MTTFIIDLADLDHDDLMLAGGKGVKLGAMLRAGLPVPPGFCVPANSYRTVVAPALPLITAQLSTLDVNDNVALEAASQVIRAKIEALPLPPAIADAIAGAYVALRQDPGAAPVAVRSSATAEDLPDASFAGQQETFLNVRGVAGLLSAVRLCWSSLWTPRAIAYRWRNGFDHRTVALAVLVQQMIDAQAAGVLFTADPVNGNRTRMVINASWGLGEAIASGIVSPDRWTLDRDGTMLESEVGTKERMVVYSTDGGTVEQRVPVELRGKWSLAEADLGRLVELGRKAEQHSGSPQDIEWALCDRQIYLLQSRPITTLFPIPTPPPGDDDLHVYLSMNAFQGVTEPFTPMGISLFRELAAFIQSVTGGEPVRPGRLGYMPEAAGRLFFDGTAALRHPIGRRMIQYPFRMMDQSTAYAFPVLLQDPRLKLRGLEIGAVARRVLPLVRRSGPLLRSFVQAWRDPAVARRNADFAMETRMQQAERLSERPQTLDERVLMVRVLLRGLAGVIFGTFTPLVGPGLRSSMLVECLAHCWGLNLEKVAALRRGLPGNPTTEMDLALWRLSQRIKSDPATRELFEREEPTTIARLYQEQLMPGVPRRGLEGFLARYGHRGVREIDVGMPRWSEMPEYIINTLRNYLLVDDPAGMPDVRFAALVREAEIAEADLVHAARTQGWGVVKAAVLRFLIYRMRTLMGTREASRFWGARMFSLLRRVLWGAGEELVRRGLIEQAGDVFFLTLVELDGVDNDVEGGFRRRVAERRATYERELVRRQVPRIITSEGEIIRADQPTSNPLELAGVGVSAGVHEGFVRVIHDPHDVQLKPGEILVTPSADPAWTPLFLTAGGLVMETGGTLSHGSVVAREYGIPAVVAVTDATTRLRTGQKVRIDGTLGVVNLSYEVEQ